MPTKTKKSRGSDRKRVSSQKHEISYAGKKLGTGGASAVRKAKAKLGRKTSRPRVMKEAKKLLPLRAKAENLVAALGKTITTT